MKPQIRFIQIVLIFIGLSTSLYSWAQHDSQNVDEINRNLSRILDDEGLAGIVWSTVSKGQTFTGSAGLSHIENSIAMANTSAVHVGSVAKTLLAVGVLRLIATSNLTLDSEVAQLLPNRSIDNNWNAEAPIRVRHLLEHTAGLDNLRMWQFLNSKPTQNTPLEKSFPATEHSLLRVRSKPGSQYSYSNMGYVLLAMVIEKVSSERYEDYLNRELLTPLGMHHSTFHFTHQQQTKDVPLAMGYLDDMQAMPAQNSYLRPAGQFTTTAKDMVKFSSFLLGDGSLNGELFISPEMMMQLGKPTTTDAAKAGLEIGHGLALAGRDRHGVLGHCHPGETFGFRANLCVFPGQGKGFFYAVNTDNETANYERLTQLFIKALRLNEQASFPPPLAIEKEAKPRRLLPTKPE